MIIIQYERRELFEPITNNQDKQQNKIIKELHSNQKDIKELIESNRNMISGQELPAIESTRREGPTILQVDIHFNKEDQIILKNYELEKPSNLFNKSDNDLITLKDEVNKINIHLGVKKPFVKKEEQDDERY